MSLKSLNKLVDRLSPQATEGENVNDTRSDLASVSACRRNMSREEQLILAREYDSLVKCDRLDGTLEHFAESRKLFFKVTRGELSRSARANAKFSRKRGLETFNCLKSISYGNEGIAVPLCGETKIPTLFRQPCTQVPLQRVLRLRQDGNQLLDNRLLQTLDRSQGLCKHTAHLFALFAARLRSGSYAGGTFPRSDSACCHLLRAVSCDVTPHFVWVVVVQVVIVVVVFVAGFTASGHERHHGL